MTTQRAVAFLLVTGGLVLFAVQNSSPWLSLTVFGVMIQPLPLSFWLVAAIAMGSFTTLFLVGLLNLYGPERRPKSPRKSRTRAPSSSRGTASPYGRTAQPKANWSHPTESPPGSAGTDSIPNPVGANQANDQDWDAFKPPEQWEDWGQRPDPSVVATTPDQPSSTQGKSKRKSRRQKEQYAVEESFEQLAGGWDEYEESAYEEPAYIPRGGSPVEDALDEISSGWDGYEDDYADYQDGYEESEDKPTPPLKDYEVKQAPKTVYRSGSLYSYSYDKTEPSDADRVEDAEPSEGRNDDQIDDIAEEDYPANPRNPAANRPTPGSGRVGPDGVFEADYRVIIPPTRNLDEDDDWENKP